MTDYEGKPIHVGDRVELHPGCDLWMRGAKYGTVTALNATYATVRMDWASVRLEQYVKFQDCRTVCP